MEAKELRNTVLEYINTADERLLNIVKAVVESYREDDAVAFYPDGTPMTQKQYKEALDKAENQVAEGDYTLAEDFLNEEN